MDSFKSLLIDKFSKELDSLDLSLDINTLEMKYNQISQDIFETIKIKKEQIAVPISKTSNNNICSSDFNALCSGKSSEVMINDSGHINPNIIKKEINTTSTIPSDFALTYEMKQFATSKFVQNVEAVFEDFKLYYQSKATTNSDWEAVWKRWILNQNKYKNHLIKTTIDENLELDTSMRNIAKKYIGADDLEIEFRKFKNHYISTGDLKVSWSSVWENWCLNYKQFKPKEHTTSAPSQKAAYKWDFRKAKETSDRIKDWLEFEKKINWLDDFYWKDIPIPGIGWQKVMHPDFNKEEILLYKIDSDSGNYMIQHKTNDIIDAEVLEND
jgi:hypothetical protein